MKVQVLTAGLALGALLASVPACRADNTVGTFHRNFHVSGPAHLDVSTGAGAIEVTGAPGSTVSVDGTIYASDDVFGGGADPADVREAEAHPPITQTGNAITIRSLPGGWSGRNRHLWISYVITTPPDTDVEAHTGSGTITVAGVSGSAELGAGSGRLRVADLGGSLRAQTGSGGISFDRIGGEARLSTGSGSIEGNEVAGRLDARAGSGHISVRQLDQGGEVSTASGGIELDAVQGDLSAHAASGSLEVGGVLAGSHNWDLSTASGRIRITLPPTTSATVRLRTSSGGISVNHPMSGQMQSRHGWDGVIGADAPQATLSVHTASGSIRVN